MKIKWTIWTLVAGVCVLLSGPLLGLGYIAYTLGGAALYSSNYLYPDYIHRYRLTVNVEVGGVVHSASGVYEVHTKPEPDFLRKVGNGPEQPQAIGEAITMDLGARGLLIMLLRGHGDYDPRSMAFMTFARYPQPGNGRTELLKRMATLRAEADIPRDQLWTFVVLSDPKNPTTMRQVDVARPEQTLGADVKFLPAHIEMTSDPVNHGIEITLPWVKNASTGLIFQFNRPDAPFSYERRDFELRGQ